MTMMISKFHRLIQSRALWLVFLVVIVFSFVIWGMQMPDSGRGRDVEPPGTLAGKPVPPEEFFAAYRQEETRLFLMFGRRMPQDDALHSYLRDAAWLRLAGWREADRLGIRVGDDEVLRALREEPFFQENGRFSMDRYRGFLHHIANELRLSEQGFEEYLRGDLRTRRLASMVELSTLVPPAEIEQAVSRHVEQLTAEFVAIGAEQVADTVEIDEADARRVYERDPDAYRIPPKVRLRYIHVDAARFSDAIGEFSVEAVEDYYEFHARQFQRFDFSVDEDGQPTSPRPVTPPLEDIRDEVVERMRTEAARNRAREEADRFMRLIAPYFTSNPVSFEEAAERVGLEIRAAEPVAQGERIPGTTAPRSASEAAFALQPGPDTYFTEPFTGEDGAYVFALVERIPAEIPDFEAVRDRAMAAARTERITERKREAAEAFRARLLAGETMAEIAAEAGVDVETVGPFAPAAGPDSHRARPLAGVLGGLNPGEVADPVPAPDGSILIARLITREPGDPDERGRIAENLREQLRQQKTNLAFQAWLRGLLERDGFEERRLPDEDPDPYAEI